MATPTTRHDPSPLPPAALRDSPTEGLTLPPSPSRQHLPTPTTRRQPSPLPPAALSSSPKKDLTLPPSPTHAHLPTPRRHAEPAPLPPAALHSSPTKELTLPPSPSHKPLPTPHTHAQPTPLPPSALNSSPTKQLALPPSPTHEPLPTPETLTKPTPLPPCALRSPFITRGAVSALVTRTPPLAAASSEAALYLKRKEGQETGGVSESAPYNSVLTVEEQKQQARNRPPSGLTLRSPTPSRGSGSEGEQEEDGDFTLPFKRYDPSDPKRIEKEKEKQIKIEVELEKKLATNPPIMGMAHPKYAHDPSYSAHERAVEEERKKRAQYVTGRVGEGAGAAVPSILAQDNRVAIEVEGEVNSLVHFDMGQAFAWDFLRKKQRITREDYEMALKIQREEEAKIAKLTQAAKETEMSDAEYAQQLAEEKALKERLLREAAKETELSDAEYARQLAETNLQEKALKERLLREAAKETELSDAEYARQLAEERSLQQSIIRNQHHQEQQLNLSDLTASLLRDLESGGFDLAELGLPQQPEPQHEYQPQVHIPVHHEPQPQQVQGLTDSMMKRPLQMSTADLSQSMMTEKWRTLTDMRLAKNERERENIRTLLDLEIATKMAEGMTLSNIFMSMNPENKMWGMVENLRCFPSFSRSGQNFGPIQEGNGIYLPNSIREYLDITPGESIHLEVVNPSIPNRQRYVGSIDFVETVGVAIVPPSVMEDLKLDVGDVAQFCRIEMPYAAKVTFKSELHFEFEMNDLKKIVGPFFSFETGARITMKDFAGRDHVLTCTEVLPESPAALAFAEGITTFEVTMPEAGHQIPFIKFDVNGNGAEGWVEEGETVYYVFNTDESMANKDLLVSVDAKIGDPDFFVCVDTFYPRERVEPQNLGREKHHWASSPKQKSILIQAGDAKRKLGTKFFIAVKGYDFSAAFIVSVKTQ